MASTKAKRAIAIGLGGAVIVLAALCALGWYADRRLFSIDFTPMTFDSAAWKSSSSPDTWESPRLRMVDDLLARRLLENSDQATVGELLGPADDTRSFRADNRWVYLLGRERSGMAIDCEWLLIDFDARGHVVNAGLARD